MVKNTFERNKNKFLLMYAHFFLYSLKLFQKSSFSLKKDRKEEKAEDEIFWWDCGAAD